MKLKKSNLTWAILCLLPLSACTGGSDISAPITPVSASASEPGFAPKTAAPGPQVRTWAKDVLIFNGDGAAYDDPESLADIVSSHGLTYEYADSSRLNSMSMDELMKFGTLVWPGGYAGQQADSLSVETREKIRKAVTENGLNYTGFCAGAFIAVGAMPAPGKAPDYGMALVEGKELGYFYPNHDGNSDTETMVPVKFGDGSSRELVFWGGPAVTDFPGGVVGRYADGTPAISQAFSGKGLVTISGPHPEAPETWYTKLGLTDSDGLDHETAFALINSSLKQVPLKAF